MVLATLAMALCARGALTLVSGLFDLGKFGLLICLGVSACVGLLIYLICAYLLKLDEARMSVGLVKQILKRG